MSSIITYGYGSDSSGQTVPSYGYGSVSSQLSIVPGSGTMLGGDIFSITSTGLSISDYIDTFQAYNAANWTANSTGVASITIANGMKMDLGTASGSNTLSSTYLCSSVDFTIKYSYDSTIEQLNPPAMVFCGLKLRVTTSLTCHIEHAWDPIKGSIIRASVVTDGIVRETNYINAKDTSGYLTIKRHKGKVQMYSGSTLVLQSTSWSDATCYVDIYNSNSSAPQALQVLVSSFIPRPVVLFDGTMAEGVIEYDSRYMSGYAPSRLFPGQVDVSVVLVNYEVTLGSGYLYIAPKQLTISKQSLTVTINNDQTLRDIG